MKTLSWLPPIACFVIGLAAVVVVHQTWQSPHASPTPIVPREEVEAHMTRAREYLAEQKVIEAHAEAEKAEVLAPQDARVQSLLGDVADASLRKEAAEHYYRRATELDPDHVVARANLALVLLDL